MDANTFVLLLCIALLLGTSSTKVEREAQIVSNLTDTSVSQIVVTDSSKSRDHSTNITTTTNQLGATSDGSETKQPIVDDSTSQKSIGGGGSDESESSAATTSNSSSSSRKKKQGEDCDPSYMCSDDQHLFLACLRVPGDDDDAPHLSLLIKNKAKAALLLTITAPSFVRLETNKVQLPESQDTKVKVSIKKGGSNDSSIVLTSSNGGHCSLDLKDLAGASSHDTGKDSTVAVSRPSILNISSRTLIVIAMISFLVLSLVIIPVIYHVYRSKSQGKSKYQRLDNMELPVSSTAAAAPLVSKSDQESGDDGWNNNWGDDWGDGDEEQPNTPVLPLTPSVSSRGLAPRRLSKEGWKD
ncbi:uncharacterized protein LOC108823339 [Raphanus sativus]|uniref:Uncharacterized protein LOC108823339 n=1 Tax=Raphanus sativus TaxID=3726 RepID=A0A6J0KWQ6_RAPSA|nr:uncharacterized protein LOC108823339 [Raphanus sativus]